MAFKSNLDRPTADSNRLESTSDAFSTQPNARQSVVISVNPNSGAADRSTLIEETKVKLLAAGFVVDVLSNVDQVVSMAIEKSTEGKLRAVVAAGGDGTVALLANRLPPGVPITILPLGTENLLAKHFGFEANVNSLTEVLINGRYLQMDAGRANGKLFLVMASCGFDANVVEKLHRSRTGHISYWSWLRPIVSSIRRYRYPELRISIDVIDDMGASSTCQTLTGRWVFVFNAPRYAMNLPLLPEADPTDGVLNVCSFRHGGLVRGVVYLIAVVLRKHRQWCKTEFRKFRKMTIDSKTRVPFQLDGDPGGDLPVTIEVLPNYLTILAAEKLTCGESQSSREP